MHEAPVAERPDTLSQALETLTERLLSRRTRRGHWEGRLSSSALATATAVSALALASQDDRRQGHVIERGLDWLARQRNADGGWGDTPLSLSNISTTSLCWSAFFLSQAASRHAAVVGSADAWLRRAAGGLDAASLRNAILRRYGNDHTFSVPILTVLALAGKLGQGPAAWAGIPQLPFELAVLPHASFQWLRLPVVSYALPALIALGQARHHQRPTSNPLTRVLRSWAREPSLRLLERIQPSSGGFLEAVPLTSFVVMSLAAQGRASHGAVSRGVEFLIRSAREDGSWPIDTNLATWVTTLCVNALSHRPDFERVLPAAAREQIRDWLLAQQLQAEHPYTHAAPGGWAWTDLPGGVPDADDTAGALLALRALGPLDEPARRAALKGVRWLLGVQNRDGGIPTFCRGWGALEFDRSSPDLTAHALRAWNAWGAELSQPVRAELEAASRRALRFLARTQRRDGAWSPLWFGNQHTDSEANLTYGTGRVLVAFSELSAQWAGAAAASRRGLTWLIEAQNDDGGWGGAAGVASSIEETAIAVDALAAHGPVRELEPPLVRGVCWLIERSDRGRETPPSPIGLYFARLWYFEELYPLIFAAGALARASRVL